MFLLTAERYLLLLIATAGSVPLLSPVANGVDTPGYINFVSQVAHGRPVIFGGPFDLVESLNRPRYILGRMQNLIPMGIESYLLLWVFTDERCHPNRFRVELMLIESSEIGRLDFPNCNTLKSTHCFCLTSIR